MEHYPMGISVKELFFHVYFRVFFCYKKRGDLHFVSFCTMDVSRCILITAEEYIWKNTAQYLSKRCLKYNWIVNRPKDMEKSEVEVFVWWCGKGVFSATPLRSYLKRLKQKNHKECFKISKTVKTESILKKLVYSTKTHYWDDGFIGKELMEYLKVGISRLKKESKVTAKMNTEVTEQESGPFDSFLQGPQPSASQPSDPQPQPSDSQPQQSDPQPQQSETISQVKDDKKRKDNKQRVKLSQNQINGLVLKLLSRTASNVTNVSKDIAKISRKYDKVNRLNKTFRTEMIKVNSKMDKLAKTLNHKLYDPLFDDDCKCDKCMT